MAEKESFFSRFFRNKKKEGCCCQLKITKSEQSTKTPDEKNKSEGNKENK